LRFEKEKRFMGELSVSKEIILGALSTVQEPDLKKDLVTLNMIKDVELGVGEVRFTVVLTTPACPLKEKIRKDCEDAIHNVAHVVLPMLRVRRAPSHRFLHRPFQHRP
jgi:ATP-binding protein involved in chromosome partitioning